MVRNAKERQPEKRIFSQQNFVYTQQWVMAREEFDVTILLFLAFQLEVGLREQVVTAFAKLDRFEVSFRQETFSDFFEDTVVEGKLMVQRPGRMHMTYNKGDKKTLIWDGVTCYEKDHLADTETRTPQADVADEPLVRILLYGEDLGKLFLIDRLESEVGDVFRFRPRDNQTWEVEVVFDKDWLPKTLEVIDEEGEGSRFIFSGYNLDPKFSETRFAIPKG